MVDFPANLREALRGALLEAFLSGDDVFAGTLQTYSGRSAPLLAATPFSAKILSAFRVFTGPNGPQNHPPCQHSISPISKAAFFCMPTNDGPIS